MLPTVVPSTEMPISFQFSYSVPIIEASPAACLLYPQAKVHEAMMTCITAHRMTTANQYDDVYRCLVRIINEGVTLAWSSKREADLITKQPAVAAIMATALQGFTALAEQEVADEAKRPLDGTELSLKYPRSRATLIRNMAFNKEDAGNVVWDDGNPNHSLSEFVVATHVPVYVELRPVTQLANLLLKSCYTLNDSNEALTVLMQRLGVPEVALRCGEQQEAVPCIAVTMLPGSGLCMPLALLFACCLLCDVNNYAQAVSTWLIYRRPSHALKARGRAIVPTWYGTCFTMCI